MLIEPRCYSITSFQAGIPKLNLPLRILHLSDIHFAGPDRHLTKFFDKLAATEADLIVLTGDIIDCREGVARAEEELSKLKSKYGIFAVMGNHDYYDYNLFDSLFRVIQG